MPIGPYVADFACMAARVVIELDGSQHATGPHQIRDERRTRWFESEGYRVIRFWNNDLSIISMACSTQFMRRCTAHATLRRGR